MYKKQANDENGNKTSQNIVGPQGNIIATVRYDDGQHAYFYNKDVRTSVTNVVDESGNGVTGYKYDDYGATAKYGDPLGKPTVNVPVGVYYKNFTKSAIGALKNFKSYRKKYKINKNSKDIVAMV